MNYKWALAIYCLLFLALTSPLLIHGEIVAPYRLSSEINANDANADSNSSHIENHKFSDQINSYIPEIQANLNGKKSGWLTLWTNQNELGRPTYHISGLSPAYLPSWVISQFTDDPWYFFSTLTITTCFLAGLLMIFFCREIQLHPWAGLIAGISLSASPVFMYWITFPMFPAVWCWTVGIMWGATRLSKTPDLTGASVLAFSIYSLLMTSYPQLIVFHAYLLVGYGIHLCYSSYRENTSRFWQFITSSGIAIVVGMVMALPTYLDLWQLATESGRSSPDQSFFLVTLPQLGSAVENIRFFLLSTVPELFGLPISSDFKFLYNGISFTLPVLFFAAIGILTTRKNIWGWCLAIFICGAFAFVQPLYIFGIQYLGFNLSRSNPLAATVIPMLMMAAFGVHQFFLCQNKSRLDKSIRIALTFIATVVIAGILFAVNQAISIRWNIAITMFLVIGLFAIQLNRPKPLALLVIVAIELITISYPLMLHQRHENMVMRSHYVDKIANETGNDARFAVISPGIATLLPNLNAILNLPSLHSYNSLSSRRYHILINRLGGEIQTFGRWNFSISPDYAGSDFWMSNISLVVSPVTLNAENLVYAGKESDTFLYKVTSRMGNSLQIATPSLIVTQNINVRDPRAISNYTPTKISDKGDQLEYEVRSLDSQSVFILSQKYHRDWEAQVLSDGGWKNAPSVVINDVFQGVVLPKHAQRVRLEFKPFVRYALYANLFWSLLTGFIFIRFIMTTQRNRKSNLSMP